MKKETAIRIAALFDCEANSTEQAEVRAILDSDPEAQAYWDQLQQLSGAVQGAHVSRTDPQFQWNQFRKQFGESRPRKQETILYFPKFASVAAALVATAVGIWFTGQRFDPDSATDITGLDESVYMVETDLENATPIVYIDEPSGWTVVWVVEQDDQDPVDG